MTLEKTRRPPDPWGSNAGRRVRKARDRLLGGSEFDREAADALVRPEIASSWQRSAMSGLDPNRVPRLPHNAGQQIPPRLLQAAVPILEDLGKQLQKTAIVLADSESWIVWRGSEDAELLDKLDGIELNQGSSLAEDSLGTNGVGTAVEVRAPLIIAGGEHYLEVLQDFTCASMPLRDPLTHRLAGILNLTCRYKDTNDAMFPLIAGAVRQIESRLFEGSSTRERALFDAFVRLSRTPALAVASMNEDVLIANAQAAQLFEPADHALLWDWALACIRNDRALTGDLTLSRGIRVTARCSPITDGKDVAGVAVTITPQTASARSKPLRSLRASASGSGNVWQRLVDRTSQALAGSRRVLLLGEHGVGKTMLAKHVALNLGESDLVQLIDCGLDATGSKALLIEQLETELAKPDEGFLVLRHIDSLSLKTAAAAASLIESGERRVILTGTEVVPSDDDRARLHNLVEVAIAVPPLRERKGDIPDLVSAMIRQLSDASPTPRCSSALLAAFMRYDWPGNVAEMNRVVKTALVNSHNSDIRVQDVPGPYRELVMVRPLGGMERAERDAILEALRRCDWQYSIAAEELGISRATIYRKVKALGIQRPI